MLSALRMKVQTQKKLLSPQATLMREFVGANETLKLKKGVDHKLNPK